MKTAAIIVLLMLCIALVIHLVIIKLQMRKITEELQRNLDPAYNRQISVTLLDRSLSRLTAAINSSLDEQRRLKRDAERAERNLRQSVSDIAHDLRTPMTVIKGNLQLLAQEEQLSGHGAEYLSISREKADALKEMADTFFEMSVLESDDAAAQLTQVNLTKVLMQFLADSEAAIRLHHLEPEIVFPEKTVYIRADEQMLLRMLGNVLNNLLKYAEGSFRLSVSQDDAGCTLARCGGSDAGSCPDVHAQLPRRCLTQRRKRRTRALYRAPARRKAECKGQRRNRRRSPDNQHHIPERII